MPFKDYLGELTGFGITAGVTFTLYHVIKIGEEVLHNLKNTEDIEVNSNLVTELIEHGGSVVSCVKGIVRADGSAIKSVARPEVTGVVWKKTIKEHLVAQVMGFWTNDQRTVDEVTSSVPFFIMNKGIGVKIGDPGKLDMADLTVVSEKFEPATNSLADHVWGWMKGVRPTGTQQTEEMLVEGTRVLGVGRLVLREQEIHLEHTDLVPYVVTTSDMKTLIENHASPLPWLRFLAFLTGCGAAFYAYRIISRFWKTWRKELRTRRELRELEEARRRRDTSGQDLPESFMCVVCFGLRDVVIIPCQHVCVCGECAVKLEPRVCPVCRTAIERIQPVFFS